MVSVDTRAAGLHAAILHDAAAADDAATIHDATTTATTGGNTIQGLSAGFADDGAYVADDAVPARAYAGVWGGWSFWSTANEHGRRADASLPATANSTR